MNVLYKWLVKRTLKKPAPARVPRSGEAAKVSDCYVTYVESREDDWSLLVESINDRGVEGRYVDGTENDEVIKVSIPFSFASQSDFVVEHFYRQYNLRYSSLNHYLKDVVFQISKFKILYNSLSQLVYNRQRLVRADRISVLKILLEETINNDDLYEFTTARLTTLLHTIRWVLHPEKNKQSKYNSLLISSLVESGELTRGLRNGYVLTAKALETISKYEDDKNRHDELMSNSRSMKRLTAALIFVGLVQAYIAYYIGIT